MSKVFINESSLTSIGNAIRGKTGGSELLSVPDGMVAAIESITTGGGSAVLPEELKVITGNVQHLFSKDYATLYVNAFGKQITTRDLVDAQMFYGNRTIEEVPFDLNIASGYTNNLFDGCSKLKKIKDINIANATNTDNSIGGLFSGCKKLKEIGVIRNPMITRLARTFEDCNNLNYFPKIEGAVSVNTGIDLANFIFQYCFGLREVDSSFLKLLRVNNHYSWNNGYQNTFNSCYSMDRIVGLGVPISSSSETHTNNLYSQAFQYCHRLDELTFETNDDGTPKELYANNQFIDLSYEVGYCPRSRWTVCNIVGDIKEGQSVPNFYDYIQPSASPTDIWNYQITADKNTEDYYNNKDSWTDDLLYSRYNHRSMVNTINTLPDTSTFLASNGGTNTIAFRDTQGDSSPWGGTSNLTEEEIAVAVAKGWTVTFADGGGHYEEH